MADQRVHPRADSSASSSSHSPSRSSVSSSTATTEFAMKPYPPPSADQPVPPPGTYVIQIPKDQIYRVPPPENAYRFRNYTRQKARKSRCCCRFLFWSFVTILILAVLAGIGVGVFYLIIRPQTPNYSIDSLSFSGFNLTIASTINPQIDVVVRANNPNKKISIEYLNGGAAAAYHGDVKLCGGDLPAFIQPRRNVTVVESALTGLGLVLGSASRDAIVKEQSAKSVALRLNLRSPVKLKVGTVTTWRITVKVRCDVTVDALVAGATIVDKSCRFGVKLW